VSLETEINTGKLVNWLLGVLVTALLFVGSCNVTFMRGEVEEVKQTQVINRETIANLRVDTAQLETRQTEIKSSLTEIKLQLTEIQRSLDAKR